MAKGIEKGEFISAAAPAARLGLPTMVRLGLFQMGLGIMSLLTLGVLNRVMIKELALPATIVAATIAMNQFVAPSRGVVWGKCPIPSPSAAATARAMSGWGRRCLRWLRFWRCRLCGG